MPETIKLLESTKSNITEDENGENVSHLEITEAVLIHCNIVNNDYVYIFACLHFFLINQSVNY